MVVVLPGESGGKMIRRGIMKKVCDVRCQIVFIVCKVNQLRRNPRYYLQTITNQSRYYALTQVSIIE